MCGIAGGMMFRGASNALDLRVVVSAMADRVAHRGPDDQGLWASDDGSVALAHRRLAVVDLSPRGHQPMSTPDRKIWITFNGEIYNFRKLRARLAAEGESFVSDSDTEVVLAAYRRWGLARALESFEGMFAFALWDDSTQTLHLARDRAGERPLFVGIVDSSVLFASELRAFAPVSSRLSIDRASVGGFLSLGYVPGPGSMYAEVGRLPPASHLSIRRGDGALRTDSQDLVGRAQRYWSADAVPGPSPALRHTSETLDAAADELDALLRDVTADALQCDVPVGIFLSGGIDSSLVAALAQAVSTQPVHAYTVAFGERDFDESQHAARIAAHLGLRHEILRLTPGAVVAAVPELASNLDEPTANASYFPIVLMSRLARKKVTVVLSGDGGDEVFCGYNRYRQLDRLLRAQKVVPRVLLSEAARAASALAGLFRAGHGLKLATMPQVLPLEALRRAERFLAHEDFDGAYGACMRLYDTGALAAVGLEAYAQRRASPQAEDRLLSMMRYDFGDYLPDDNLAKVDRAAMSTALEVRLPLLSHRVVELSWRLGRSAWLAEGRSKWLLRKLLARYVPPALFERPKMGFTVPVGEWLRGPLREWATAMIESPQLEATLGVRAVFVRSEWRSFLAGPGGEPRRIWALVMLGAWASHEGRVRG
jgi:asparagine synthase (glutamine-hydrolysing)